MTSVLQRSCFSVELRVLHEFSKDNSRIPTLILTSPPPLANLYTGHSSTKQYGHSNDIVLLKKHYHRTKNFLILPGEKPEKVHGMINLYVRSSSQSRWHDALIVYLPYNGV